MAAIASMCALALVAGCSSSDSGGAGKTNVHFFASTTTTQAGFEAEV